MKWINTTCSYSLQVNHLVCFKHRRTASKYVFGVCVLRGEARETLSGERKGANDFHLAECEVGPKHVREPA